MKALLITFTTLALVGLGTAPQAEARSHRTTVYVSSYLPCGTPIYHERYICGYDRWGNPLWATRPVRAPYRPAYRPIPRPIYRPVCRPVIPPRYVAPCPPRFGSGVEFHATWSR